MAQIFWVVAATEWSPMPQNPWHILLGRQVGGTLYDRIHEQVWHGRPNEEFSNWSKMEVREFTFRIRIPRWWWFTCNPKVQHWSLKATQFGKPKVLELANALDTYIPRAKTWYRPSLPYCQIEEWYSSISGPWYCCNRSCERGIVKTVMQLKSLVIRDTIPLLVLVFEMVP